MFFADFGNALHRLGFRSDGNYHNAANLELLKQGLGYVGGTASNDDFVVGSVLLKPLESVAEVNDDLVVDFGKQVLGAAEKLQVAFHRKNACSHSTQNGGLKTGTGADFQNLFVGLNLEQLALKSHGGRLRDGLVAKNGKGGLFGLFKK